MKLTRYTKLFAGICAGGMALSMLVACSDSSSSSTSVVSSTATASAGALTVQVESVDGDTVTAVVGELQQLTMGEGGGMGEGGTPPDMADGEAPSDMGEMQVPDGEAPSDMGEMQAPDGEVPSDMGEMQAPDGEAPSGGQPGGSGSSMNEFVAGDETITFTIDDSTTITVEFLQGSQEGTAESIVVGAVLTVTLNSSSVAEEIVVKNLSAGGGFGGSDTVTNGTSANTIENDIEVTGETYTSAGDDENALRVDGAVVSLASVTVEKTGGESSNTEDGDFYGQNAGFLALNGATVTITGSTFNTSAVNGNAVFSYGEGTIVNIADSTIRTTANNSGGIQTTGGATMNASNLDVQTEGTSSAAVRSDRGGGTVVVDGGTYVTNGTGSPAVYSTADITVKNATLTANSSEGVVVEGKNSVVLENTDVTGSMVSTYGEDESQNIHNIMIYQSMSGDADVGHASFSATGGSITALNGDMFYVTNTSCTISLENVSLNLANNVLLHIAGNDGSRGWGTVGANGGQVTFEASAQQLSGEIVVDEISTLDITLSNASSLNGSINAENSGAEINVTLASDSQWSLTADSYITSLDGDTANITMNGYTLYVNGVAVS